MNEPRPAPAPTATITPAPPVAPAEFSHGGAQITPSEAATMAEWAKQDLLSGKITQAQADQQFTELNVPIEQRGSDVRTDEQRLMDAHFPAAKPEDYLWRKPPSTWTTGNLSNMATPNLRSWSGPTVVKTNCRRSCAPRR
ncbi:MAG TPA: hypothetical protein VF205_10945 [Nitrospiraceae bacterium]